MFRWESIKRAKIVLTFFVILFILIIARIVQFQIINSKKYSVMANAQYSYKEDLCDTNFLIFDSKGKQLLDYKDKYLAVLVPDVFSKDNMDTSEEDMLTLMYTLRNYNSDYDVAKIGLLNSSQKLYYEVDKSTYEKLKNVKNVKGFYCYKYTSVDSTGVWKVENMLINSKRACDNSLKAEDSLEMKIYNKTKQNKKPEIVFLKDVNGKIIEEKVQVYDSNIDIRATLDKEIQQKIKGVLLKSQKYKQVGAILMESNTGKILGMVQKDDNEPNVNIGVATSNGFYPGSIFKVIVEETGLNRGTLKESDKFTCRGLYEDKHKNHGTLSLEEALVVSCNDVFSQIGANVGFNNFYDNAKAQGLFNKVLNLDGEVAGKNEIAQPKLKDGTLSLASIGQTIRITPIEAISIVNTVVNGGNYVKPYLIDAYVDDKNNEMEKLNTESKAVINRQTANILKKQMINVVKYGTGEGTNIEGVEVGGKTGTTQRIELSTNDSKKKIEHSDGWFIGFFKAYDKYYSLVVFVQDINTESESGGNTAVPIFKEIVKEVKENLR